MPRRFTPEYYPGAKAQAKVYHQLATMATPAT
jgi:hypothetical protein